MPGPVPATTEAAIRDLARGALLGLAVGDAVGTTLEFKPRDSYAPLQDMIDRMLFAEALETQKCFVEGVITTTADANSGSIMGIGFPPWTGGAAQYITGYPGGKTAFVARAKELAARYGDRFTPPASLLK